MLMPHVLYTYIARQRAASLRRNVLYCWNPSMLFLSVCNIRRRHHRRRRRLFECLCEMWPVIAQLLFLKKLFIL